MVFGFDPRLDDDPIFDRYAVWLDETQPGEWFELGCIDAATDTVEAWLATEPDLGELGP